MIYQPYAPSHFQPKINGDVQPEQWRTVGIPFVKDGGLSRIVGESEKGVFQLFKLSNDDICDFGPALTWDQAIKYANRILGGDAQALTHPRMLLALATAVVGIEGNCQNEQFDAQEAAGVKNDTPPT